MENELYIQLILFRFYLNCSTPIYSLLHLNGGPVISKETNLKLQLVIVKGMVHCNRMTRNLHTTSNGLHIGSTSVAKY